MLTRVSVDFFKSILLHVSAAFLSILFYLWLAILKLPQELAPEIKQNGSIFYTSSEFWALVFTIKQRK